MPTALPKLEGLHTIAASSIGVNVDAAGLKYIPAGDYYWSSVADGGSVSLQSAMQTLLTTGPGAVAAATVTVSDTTGIMTIAWGSAHALVWANNASRDRFGASGNLASASTHAMAYQVEGAWFPNVLGLVNGSVLGVGIPESDRRVTISRSGAVCATSSAERERAVFKWRGLTKAKMFSADEATANASNESLETFWRDCLNYRGGIFRRHADRTNDATYTTWQCLLEDGLKPTRFKQQYDAVWDSGDIPAMAYVHVAVGGGF